MSQYSLQALQRPVADGASLKACGQVTPGLLHIGRHWDGVGLQPQEIKANHIQLIWQTLPTHEQVKLVHLLLDHGLRGEMLKSGSTGFNEHYCTFLMTFWGTFDSAAAAARNTIIILLMTIMFSANLNHQIHCLLVSHSPRLQLNHPHLHFPTALPAPPSAR